MATQSQVHEFEQLMASLAAGSEDAAWQLTERYTPHIVRSVRATLPSRLRRLLDSQDFTQAVWASLLSKRVEIGEIESEQALIGYLARTAKNKVVDACRRYMESQKRDIRRDQAIADLDVKQIGANRGANNTRPTGDAISHRETPSQVAMLRERWQAVLATEPERNRELMELRVRGESFASIAEQLKIHEGTARRIVHRVLGKLTDG